MKLCVCFQLCSELTCLGINGCRVSWADFRQWLSLQELSLYHLDEVKLRQWTQLSPHLEQVRIHGDDPPDVCAVCVDDLEGRWLSLQKLKLEV